MKEVNPTDYEVSVEKLTLKEKIYMSIAFAFTICFPVYVHWVS